MPKNPTARERLTTVEIELYQLLEETKTPLCPNPATPHLAQAIVHVIQAKLAIVSPDTKPETPPADRPPAQGSLIENPRAGNGQLPPPVVNRR